MVPCGRSRLGPVAWFCALLLAILVLWAGPVAKAQGTSAEIMGTVKDATGAVLPGASLTITHRGSGQERRLVTDARGNYVAASLPVGEYVIRAELANFKMQIREGIALQVGQQARVDLVMEVGDVSQQITVRESVPLLRTTNAEVSEVINNQRMVDLPLNGRQFVQLTLLSDNVFLTPVGTRGSVADRAAGRHRGPACRAQHVLAGRRLHHRSVLQQLGRFPFRRFPPGAFCSLPTPGTSAASACCKTTARNTPNPGPSVCNGN